MSSGTRVIGGKKRGLKIEIFKQRIRRGELPKSPSGTEDKSPLLKKETVITMENKAEAKAEIIDISFNNIVGKMKPMHSVNNGPVYNPRQRGGISNIKAYQRAGIPYARNHDASLYYPYGGEHIVDVHAVFPDFSRDPYDEGSYDFTLTDEYVKATLNAGTKIFYRLGSKSEHGAKKYGTVRPLDFKKWAVICEHIIRHYNYGFANGFHCQIEYWEIWNEPDLSDGTEDKSTWGASREEFYELFNITLIHLKTSFPELKIGGPSVSGFRREWLEGFFKSLRAKPDFFSWHSYTSDIEKLARRVRYARELLDSHSLTETESILDEWNYVRAQEGEEWVESLKTIKSQKGASFTAGVMCRCQYLPLDNLMYYDARPCAHNGMFNTDFVNECLKGYYPFPMFNTLYMLGYAAEVSYAKNIYIAAATDKNGSYAIMLTFFKDTSRELYRNLKIIPRGIPIGAQVKIYLTDNEKSMECIRNEAFSGAIDIDLKLFDIYLIKIKNSEI